MRIRWKRKLRKNEEVVLRILREASSEGYALTVEDVRRGLKQRNVNLAYSTVHVILTLLETWGYAKRVRLRRGRELSGRRYWVAVL